MTSSRIGSFASGILARLKAHSRVLEIGSGAGELAALLRSRGHDVVAIDPKGAPESGSLPIPYESYDAPPHAFDAIVMQLVLHHVALDDTLDRVLGHLAPDGFIAIDDYGWERAVDADPQWRAERADLHTSAAMLRALRARFVQAVFRRHAYFGDGAGSDDVAFTFIGTPAQQWPVLIGGREKRAVVLEQSDPDWPRRFDTERRRIVDALGARVRGIDHVGSTAVPGLAAKPVVDIVVALDDPLDDEIKAALERAGYEHRVEEPDHRMFRTPQRDVHVHLWESGSAEIGRLLAFRDRLRSDDDARRRYQEVKRELAGREWDDMNDYAAAKSAIIAEILKPDSAATR